MALIAPELIVTWAMRQWFSARRITRQFEKSGYPSVRPERFEGKESPERRRNRLVVLARGVLSVAVFLWRFPVALVRWIKRSIDAYLSKNYEDNTWTQMHSFFVLMGGFMLYVDGEPYLTLRHDYILKLIREGCIDVPVLTSEQIYDRSKGNAISKGLIMLQVAWFVMELITRVIYHLEITQLEIGTFAFAVLNFLTYIVWWNKPLNVQCPYPVYWKSTTSMPEDHIDDIPATDAPAEYWIFSPVLGPIEELVGSDDIPTSRRLRVPTFDGSINLGDSDKTVLKLAALLMATIFGSIHCMAWFFTFPTYQEQVLWRVSAVAITFTPWLCFLLDLTNDLVPRVVVFVYFSIIIMSVALYIAARAVLLIIMFTTLRDLPSDAYKAVSWISLVPHL
ncbi:hypothetical protein BDR04DRAFT_1156730 [Suillus decipiens]|nr:hypothetical protein BDR04DRAFT_1156730 [Suillus decipiens]